MMMKVSQLVVLIGLCVMFDAPRALGSLPEFRQLVKESSPAVVNITAIRLKIFPGIPVLIQRLTGKPY